MKKNITLKKSNQDTFRLAIEAANIGAWELNTSNWSLSLSENIFKFLGINKSLFKGTFDSFIELIHHDDRDMVRTIINETIINNSPFDTEFRIISKKNEERWFRLRGNICKVISEGDLIILGSIHDKTERKLAFDTLEERVRKRTHELEMINRKLREEIAENRKMKKVIMDIGEKERQKIGQDLHDNLSQQLGGILFMIQSLGDQLEKKKVEGNKELKKIKKYMNNTLKYVRNLSKGLNITLSDTGLKFALSELMEEMNELYGMEIELKFSTPDDITDEKISTNIFRIIQEALNNAIKHGNAKKAAITIERKKDNIVLKISDSGIGFPPNPNKRGMGLKIMEYRASQINGTFKIKSKKNRGTEIICTFPYKNED